MTERSLQVTYRKGRAFAAYLHLSHPTGEKSARTMASLDGLLIVDYASSGRPLGIEITAPQAVPLDRLNQLLAELGADPQMLLPGIRTIVASLDNEAALFNIAPMSALVAHTIARPRLYASLLGTFALAGLALALIGIYGVMTYAVTQRTREIGIRISLGAARGDVLGLVLRQSLALAAIGILLGLAAAATMSRYLETMLFGVTRFDAMTFGAVATTFIVVALLASYVPARRATKIDPLVALRCE